MPLFLGISVQLKLRIRRKNKPEFCGFKLHPQDIIGVKISCKFAEKIIGFQFSQEDIPNLQVGLNRFLFLFMIYYFHSSCE